MLEEASDVESRVRVVACLWAVWKICNLIVFEDHAELDYRKELEKATTIGRDYLHEHQRPMTQQSPIAHRWRPLDANYFKVNTDAGLIAEGGGQVAAVIRDSLGHFVVGAIRRFPHVTHPTLLEAHGCKVGIELAISLGLSNVVIESDCQPVVHLLQHRRDDRSDLATIIDDCLAASELIDQIQFRFTHRSANSVAHVLAKKPCLFSSSPLVFFSEPSEISDVIALDRLYATA